MDDFKCFKKLLYVIFIFMWLPTLAFAGHSKKVRYESAEHIFMGNQVVLKGLAKPADKKPIKFLLDNGLKLSYGVILAMPDFYGDPNHQVSSENTFQKRKQQFLKLFHSFSNYDVSYFNAFWPIVQKERDEVAAALKAHKSVSKLYKRIIGKQLITLELVTHFKFFALAENCFDHFAHDGWLAYQAGHSVAVDTAIDGYNIASGSNAKANAACVKATHHHVCLIGLARKKLALAYEENAYANHFLTDRMASSHVRIPFRALVTTRPIAVLGAISGNYMHNEDGKYGVIVTNSTGKYWMAYGDDYYFSDQDTYHRAVIKTILQKSADEVYDAFTKGYNTDNRSKQLKSLLPQPIKPGKTVSIDGHKVTQSAPLYKLIGSSVWERKDVNNRYDDRWVQNWSTIQLLLTYHIITLSNYWKMYLRTHLSGI